MPLYYENRTPELRLVNPDLNDDIYDLIERAELDPEQEARLETELSRQYHLITRDDRLDTVAMDIVRHFLGRGFQGKAMVVSIDKATALRVYDKVRKYWQDERKRVEKDLANMSRANPDRAALEERLNTLTTTDTALVVSPGQNEIEQMKKLGLDIVPHRMRMNEQALDEKFKDPDDPLRLVFLTVSMSSEKRSISFQPLASEVPPLNVRCGPDFGSANSSRRTQHAQKSFSTLAASSPSASPAAWHNWRRRSAERARKASTLRTARVERSCA